MEDGVPATITSGRRGARALWLTVCALLLSFGISGGAEGAVYEVGPGRAYGTISGVPWESLQSGDTVLIYWRNTPYKEKWVICRQGTAGAPITVRGVPGPAGQLPVIDGRDAVTRPELNFWNEDRGVIKIGGANSPPDTMPRYVIIDGLDIRSGREPYSFTGRYGLTDYRKNAAAIYIEKGEHLIVRNCMMRDCGNGFFTASQSTDVLVEGNYVYDNGAEGSIYEHNSYTESAGIVFQYNHYGPLRTGCGGNNLKDRSKGLIVRCNWIESGNRQLDLVDAGWGDDPEYRKTFVYGNVLIEPAGAGNRQIVHYGGDGGSTSMYRKGVLYFYNNTVVSTRTDRNTIFRLSTNDEYADVRNNVFYVTLDGSSVALLAEAIPGKPASTEPSTMTAHRYTALPPASLTRALRTIASRPAPHASMPVLGSIPSPPRTPLRPSTSSTKGANRAWTRRRSTSARFRTKVG
ncbi:MAG: right-handed parallel beta-helix repeat-containing protein, partial [Planctomycetota bacterium]